MPESFFESLRRFYEENRQGLYTYALSLTGEPASAEDAVQAVFFRLLKRKRMPRDMRPYVFKSIRNAALDGKRKKSREESADLFRSEESGPDSEQYERLRASLGLLSPDERETVILKVYDGLTFREIAKVRGVPQGTAASWYRRGLEKIRSMLENER